MNGYFITGIGAGLLGIAIGFGGTHVYDGRVLAIEQVAHAKDNRKHADDIAAINAASAKALSDALAKQQVAEGKVSDIETQYNTEVANHAKDSLAYTARLAAGTDRLRIHVTRCVAAAASQGTTAPGSADGGTAYADLDPTVASGVIQVAADDQAEIDKLAALQAYVKALQDQGYIGK